MYASDLGRAQDEYERMMDGFCQVANCDRGDVIECFSSSSAYRRSIYPDYKKNRAGKATGVQGIQGATIEWPERLYRDQADDVMGIFATWPGVEDPIIATQDKDLLQIPGRHLWIATDNVPESEPGRTITLQDNHVLQYISPEWALRHFYTQALTGDTTDGIPGCPGVGPKRAATALKEKDTDLDYWEAVIRQYEKAFSDVSHASEQALRMARLVRILRYGEYDFDTQELARGSHPP